IFDAINTITHTYSPWLVSDVRAVPGASIEAAAAQAGHDTLVSLYPYLSSMFDAALADNLKHAAPAPGQLGPNVSPAGAAAVFARAWERSCAGSDELQAGQSPGPVAARSASSRPNGAGPEVGRCHAFRNAQRDAVCGSRPASDHQRGICRGVSGGQVPGSGYF